MEILNVKNLTFSYPDVNENVNIQKTALSDISFSVSGGEMIMFMGKSGCGKTTLLRLLKSELAPFGNIQGEINIVNSSEIGFVMQNPDSQTVCDDVYGELCFGLENMGLSPEEISRRVGETVCYFGIEHLMGREIHTLSGGEKQLVCLCSVMAMGPEILILDEPVSRLDPAHAESFAAVLARLNRELGTTVIMAEHFCEGLFHLCDKIAFLEEGKLMYFGEPQKAVLSRGFEIFCPAAARLALGVGVTENIPITVREGRDFLSVNFAPQKVDLKSVPACHESVLECMDLYFRYERQLPNIISAAEFCLYRGEICTVTGSNGAGKTTFLKCLGGILPAVSGKIKVFGKSVKSYKNGSLYREGIGILPQNPYDLFVKSSVREDCEYAVKAMGYDMADIHKTAEMLGVTHLMDTHPRDLSGGEAQLCGLCRVLLCKPKILLLDEPVKGLDPYSVRRIGEVLLRLKKSGMSVLMISHNLEFAAEYSDRCVMFFGGQIAGGGSPQEFFSHNRFFTTAISRISRGHTENAVTVSQLCDALNGEVK